MNTHLEKSVAILEKAIPASGYRPETEAEWKRLQRAMIRASYHLYRHMGFNKAEAWSTAKLMHGGSAGLFLLEIAFSDEGER
jgi:hypothetical protein